MMGLAKTIKNNLFFWRGRIASAKQIPNEDGYAIITTTVANRVLEGDSIPQAPVLYPYGMLSVPTKGSNAVGGFLTGTYQNPYITGILPAFTDSDVRLTGLEEGESTVYSNTYSVRVKNGGCFFASQSSTPYVTPAVIGEWMKKIQIDIIEQLQQTIGTQLGDFKTVFDAHVHTGAIVGNDTSPPNNGTFPSFTLNPDLIEDLEALETEKIFVTNTGISPT